MVTKIYLYMLHKNLGLSLGLVKGLNHLQFPIQCNYHRSLGIEPFNYLIYLIYHPT